MTTDRNPGREVPAGFPTRLFGDRFRRHTGLAEGRTDLAHVLGFDLDHHDIAGACRRRDHVDLR
jgi:hypothetical protein